MTFEDIVDQAHAMLQRRGRVTYRTLKRQFHLDDDALEDLKDELLYAQPLVVDDDGRGLVWTGAPIRPLPHALPQPSTRRRPPRSYTPPYLAEKILTSKSALEGERKQVTVLFADLKGSMELLADRDPEEARQLLDPVLERMMAAVHRYEGTVNQVMGDGIMALFGAPIAHEDHAVRACYAALAMQASVKQYAAGGAAHARRPRADPGGAELAARWWCGPSATICTWTTRPSARPRTWRPAWNRWPCRADPADRRDPAAGGRLCAGQRPGTGAGERAGGASGGV